MMPFLAQYVKTDLLSPYRQERIDHGELIRWTKGFGAANTEGRDVAAMFKKSLEKFVRPACPCFQSILSRRRAAVAYSTDRSY
jgi:hypothetical protein